MWRNSVRNEIQEASVCSRSIYPHISGPILPACTSTGQATSGQGSIHNQSHLSWENDVGKMCKLPKMGIVGGPGGKPRRRRPILKVFTTSQQKAQIAATESAETMIDGRRPRNQFKKSIYIEVLGSAASVKFIS
jgi:hypothetical protein